MLLRPAILSLALLSSALARPPVCPLPALSRSLAMSGPAHPDPHTPEFLQDRLSTLLASPHIHFNKPPSLPNGIRIMGHGPVDLFTTRFLNFFTRDATGVVCGKHVDNDGLKLALLALQRKWDPDSANFVSPDASPKPATKFLWTRSDANQPAEVTASAEIKEEGGAHRISSLTLDGDESLFSSS